MVFLRPNENAEKHTKRILREDNRLSSARTKKNKFKEIAKKTKKKPKANLESQCEKITKTKNQKAI